MGQFQGNTVKLTMKKMILDGGYYNDVTYTCKIIMYKKEEECIYLLDRKSTRLNSSHT